MGSSSSKNTLTVQNDGLQPQVAASADRDTAAEMETTAAPKGTKHFLTPDEQLKTALAPFQRLLTPEQLLPEAVPPKEQEELLQCLLTNKSNSLQCGKLAHDFARYVNKITPSEMTP